MGEDTVTEDKRTEFQNYLDSIASKNNKIDAVFVFLSKTGQIMYSSKSTGYHGFGGQETIKTFESWLGRLKDTTRLLSGIDLGHPKYLVIPFDGGLLNLYFEEKLFAQPVIIGFAYRGNDGESAMGEMLFRTDVATKKIKEYLNDVLSDE
jgi:hypothetical protein